MNLPDNLPDLADLLGEMPTGDTPAAWFMSLHPEVVAGWETYLRDSAEWKRQWAQLLTLSGLPSETRARSLGGDTLLGVVPPMGVTRVPSGWRKARSGYLAPRKHTRGEKNSEVSRLFARLAHIPRSVDYLPGLPDTLWVGEAAYPVHVRKPAQAVLAFVGRDPEAASPPFEPSEAWVRMPMSLYHLLVERVRAAREV